MDKLVTCDLNESKIINIDCLHRTCLICKKPRRTEPVNKERNVKFKFMPVLKAWLLKS